MLELQEIRPPMEGCILWKVNQDKPKFESKDYQGNLAEDYTSGNGELLVILR